MTKTADRVVMAAMRLCRYGGGFIFGQSEGKPVILYPRLAITLEDACAAHARAEAKRRKNARTS